MRTILSLAESSPEAWPIKVSWDTSFSICFNFCSSAAFASVISCHDAEMKVRFLGSGVGYLEFFATDQNDSCRQQSTRGTHNCLGVS